MKFLLDGGGPKPRDRVLIKERHGCRGEATWRRRRRLEGGGDWKEAATGPGTDARSPQKLEEAWRTLPWSLCRELSPGTP